MHRDVEGEIKKIEALVARGVQELERVHERERAEDVDARDDVEEILDCLALLRLRLDADRVLDARPRVVQPLTFQSNVPIEHSIERIMFSTPCLG